MTPAEELLTIYRALNPDGKETLLRIAKHLQDAQEVQPLLDKVEARDRARRTQGRKSNVTGLLTWKREHGFQDT